MTFRRRQFLGWSVLAAAALLGGVWIAQLDYAHKISSNVLDLIPGDEQAPELTLVRSLASQAEARTMLLELTAAGGRPAAPEAAAQFARALGREPALAEVLVMGDSVAQDALGRELFEQRFSLLLPAWLDERAAASLASERTSVNSGACSLTGMRSSTSLEIFCA